MNVETDFWDEADFTEFRSFHYSDSEKTVAAASPLAHQRIVSAIRQGMTASGFTEVEDDADVHLTYYGSTSEQLQFMTTYTGVGGWGRGRGSVRGGVGMATSSTTSTTYQRGTLVIDIWESSGDQLLWRGTITDTLNDNADKNADKINRAVSKAFDDFPPN
jgi:hypothetical protein